VVFVVASIGTHWILRVSSALGLAIAANLVLVLMMVMKRVFALTQERLRRARTGADRPSQQLAFPCAAQAIRVARRIRPLSGTRKWRTFTIYAITSLAAGQATCAQLAGWIRGHWRIEALHHIRSPGAGLAVASCGAGATRVSFSC
jgi:hypothetical protein